MQQRQTQKSNPKLLNILPPFIKYGFLFIYEITINQIKGLIVLDSQGLIVLVSFTSQVPASSDDHACCMQRARPHQWGHQGSQRVAARPGMA